MPLSAVIVGLVRSSLTATVVESLVFPALSVHVPLIAVPAPVELSSETTVGVVQLPSPLCAAAAPASPFQTKVAVTARLFHPALQRHGG